jgi:nucleotide-binding universal stress UspA family protein
MAFEHILIASGGVEHSLRAEAKAVGLAKLLEAKLTVLSVIRLTSMRTFGEAYEIERERHEALLQEATRRCEKRGLTPQILLKTGSVEHAIIEPANEINCDPIVVGRRKLSLIGTAMLGSVSDFVIRHTRCAVLVVS